jgi:hypothetical protein
MPELERDPETGKIVHSHLSSEEASAMSRSRHAAADQRADDLSGLLEEAGYPDPDKAPVHIRLLAGQFSRGGAQAVGAAREFIRLTRSGPSQPGNSHLCPMCEGAGYLPNSSLQDPSYEATLKILKLIKQLEDQPEAPIIDKEIPGL